MNNKYKIILKYTKDIDKSFRYHDTAENFMSYIANGFFIYGANLIETDPEYYYDLIINLIGTYVTTNKLTPNLLEESFSVDIYHLNGLNTLLTSTILPNVIQDTDNTLIYSGSLNQMVTNIIS